MTSHRARTPIRVCMIAPSYYPTVGGMETQIERLIPRLRAHGIESWVLTRRTGGTSPYERRDDTDIFRARIIGGPGAKSISFTTTGLARLVQERRRADLIHAHGIMSPTTLAALAGVILRVPAVVTLHATYEIEHLIGKPLGRSRLKMFRRSVARFVSITDDITTLLTAHGIPSDRIVSIGNGIDTAEYSPIETSQRRGIRLSLSIPADGPVVVFAGRLHAVKQVDVLLRALSQVTGGTLLILGDGDERQPLMRLAADLALGDRVRFLGMVSNVRDYLRAADVFVLPSASEGLSVALLEAMSTGAVPIASSVGGAVELIHDGQNGLLVPPGDEDHLAHALARVMNNPEWVARAAIEARDAVVARYDLDVIAGQLAAMYREVLKLP